MEHSSTAMPNKRKRILLTVGAVSLVVLAIIAYLVINAVNATNAGAKTTDSANTELGIAVDGVSYNTKAELSNAMKSPSWVEPRYQCFTGENYSDFDYYTDEILIDKKHYVKDAEWDTATCLEIAKEIPKETILSIEEPNTPIHEAPYAMMKQVSVYPFDEYAMMEKKVNEYPNAGSDYYYYMAMKEYGSQVVAKELNDVTSREDTYIWTVDDGAGILKEKGDIASEKAYRDGWKHAEEIANKKI